MRNKDYTKMGLAFALPLTHPFTHTFILTCIRPYTLRAQEDERSHRDEIRS